MREAPGKIGIVFYLSLHPITVYQFLFMPTSAPDIVTPETLMECGAVFSSDRKYRYRLWRIWDASLPAVFFVMLNPSRADEYSDDPTLRRVVGFARSWGYGGIYVGNLFPLVSPNPEDLLKASRPRGRNNGQHLIAMLQQSELLICAWGNAPVLKALPAWKIYEFFKRRPAFCLGLNMGGTPRHPLYLRSEVTPIPFSTD